MGFGAYEGGATGVWTLLATGCGSLSGDVGLHIVSQAVAYTLGGAAFVVIAWSSGRGVTERSGHGRKRGRDWAVAAVVGALLLGAALFALYEWRDLRKRGSLTPPAMGAAVVATSLEQAACNSLLARYHGRLVWSSNRFGNHDILMMEWPSAEIKRLTRHPHTETYPRLSPDGQRLLFARAQTAWVSQRNSGAWDTGCSISRVAARSVWRPTHSLLHGPVRMRSSFNGVTILKWCVSTCRTGRKSCCC